MGAILHSNLRHSSRRDSRGARYKTLGPGHGLQPHRFLNRIGLEDGHQLEVAIDVDALARKRSGNRGGNDEHIFVEAKSNVGHGASFLVFPIIAYARRRASLEGSVPHISHSVGAPADGATPKTSMPEQRPRKLGMVGFNAILNK